MDDIKEKQKLYETILYLTQKVKKLESENEMLKEVLKSYQRKEETYRFREDYDDPNEQFLKNQRG